MNWTLALPELVLALCGLLILVIGVFQRRNAFTLCTLLCITAMIATGFLVAAGPLGTGYEGLFVVDPFASFMKLLILAGSMLSLVLALDYNTSAAVDRFEFPILILFCTVGMLVMASASNMMTLYLGLELQSLCIYVLAAFARDTQRSAEAGLKYFVLGALASGLLLYGISLVYGFTGTMAFASLSRALFGTQSVGLVVGIVFVVAGLAFKLSAAPFHMWTPDVYEGAPTSVTAFMATAPKVAAIALLLRALITPFGHLLGSWQQLIIVVSIVSMIWGALAAIGQTNIKRLMAYSSIGHMGYALIGLAVGTPAGVRGVMIYMVTYVFMNAGTFACIIAMRRGGRSLERIADLTGLARTDPLLALALTIFMFSMAGIPPMSGFFGKLYVFLAAVQGGLWTLAVIGVLTSVIGATYYLRIIKVMYFDAGGEPLDRRTPALSIVAFAGAAFTLLFVLFSHNVINAAQLASRALLG
jgi:NADH-quinone oxidoreductase subunit N